MGCAMCRQAFRREITMKRGDRVELELTDLSYFGDGVGHVDTSLAVFAVAGWPGERVVLEIDERRQSYVRGQIKELKSSAPDRVVPPCPYYGTCGTTRSGALDLS